MKFKWFKRQNTQLVPEPNQLPQIPKDWAEIAWAKLPQEMRDQAVARLTEVLSPADLASIASQAKSDPFFHFTAGMMVRNLLRSNSRLNPTPVNPPILDGELPPLPELYGEAQSTWDDYYIQVIEAAVGKR